MARSLPIGYVGAPALTSLLKIALIGGYRVLDVNYPENNVVSNMNQRGPTLGMGFKSSNQ